MFHIISVITNETFITLGSKCCYRWDLYYTRVQLLHLCLLPSPPLPQLNNDRSFMNTFRHFRTYTCLSALISTPPYRMYLSLKLMSADQKITISASIIDLPQNCFAPERSDRDGSFHPTLPQVFWEVQEQKGFLTPSASKDMKHFNLRQITLP